MSNSSYEKKKLVLITGGSGGIGASISKYLCEEGFTPLVCYSSNKDSAHEIASRYNGVAIKLDLLNKDDIKNVIDYLNTVNDKLYGVILASSPLIKLQSFGSTEYEEIDKHYRVSVIGHHLLMSGLVRKVLKKNRTGFVVGVLSDAMGTADKAKMASASGYIIAKYGLLGLLSVLKRECSWLEVFSVSPGFTDTNMLQNSFDNRLIESLKEQGLVQSADVIAKEIVKKILSKQSDLI
jgi:3-oxoacyl-[acyl-carrier protein] reductase